MNFWQSIVLGFLQGIFEWLPVSSEAVLVLAQTQIFAQEFSSALAVTIWLHVATAFAVILYFWSDVATIFRTLFKYRSAQKIERRYLHYYIIMSVVSIAVAATIFLATQNVFEGIINRSGLMMTIIGILLLITAILQLRKKLTGQKGWWHEAKLKHVIVVAVGQGLAALPGVSRSGTTMAILLAQRFNVQDAIKTSFLIGIPIMLAGGIGQAVTAKVGVGITWNILAAMVVAFGVSLLTMHGLMRLSQKVAVGWFTLVFAIVVMAAGLLG